MSKKTSGEMLVEIVDYLREFFKDEPHKVALWLDTSNPMLGEWAPVNMILIDRLPKVWRFVMNAKKNGGPTQ